MTPKPRNKLIDLKAELAEAHDNVQLYAHIKNSTIQVMQEYPNANAEFVVNHLCEDNEMTREEFNFLCNIERMMFEDMMSSFKQSRKPKK